MSAVSNTTSDAPNVFLPRMFILAGILSFVASVFSVSLSNFFESIIRTMFLEMQFAYGSIAFESVRNTVGTFPDFRISGLHFGSWWTGVPLLIAGGIGGFNRCK